jgi:hypothetical protein
VTLEGIWGDVWSDTGVTLEGIWGDVWSDTGVTLEGIWGDIWGAKGIAGFMLGRHVRDTGVTL